MQLNGDEDGSMDARSPSPSQIDRSVALRAHVYDEFNNEFADEVLRHLALELKIESGHVVDVR